tara:strand:+ start:1057 stop:2943 length:1887 start_codon:yes stop_codon:yes gene_type:complete
MPIGFSDLLQTNSQAVNSLTKGVVSTDDTFGGVRSKIDDWTDLHLATRTGGAGSFPTFKDDGTANSPGQFKAYSTIFFVADARALVETATSTGAIRLDSSGEFVGSGGQLYTHAAGSAEPGFYVLTDPTQIDSTAKLPKFTVTGTPGSSSTVLPAGYQSFTAANNSSSAIEVVDTNANSIFNLVFSTPGADQALNVDSSTGVLTYNPSTQILTVGTAITTAAIDTGTFGLTGNVVTSLTPDGVTRDLGEIAAPWGNLFVHEGIYFEGTADLHETKLIATDATADRTITLPDASGIVGFTGADITAAAISTTNTNNPNVLTLTRADGNITANLPLATGSTVGTVSASPQAFGGLKTFDDGVTSTGTLTATNNAVFGATGNSPARTATFHSAATFNAATEFGANVSITGNLTVSGDLVQANSTAVNFEDAVLALGVPRDSSNAITNGTSTTDTGLNFVKTTAGAAITEFAGLRYDISADKFKFTRYADGGDYSDLQMISGADNVAALKFDMAAADTVVQTDQADALATMPDGQFANASAARSLGAVAKCRITITSTADGSSNFAPDIQGANGYVVKHNLNTQSIYAVAIKDPSGTPIPVFCKYEPIDGVSVRVTVGITADNEVYDIIVIG